MSQADNSVKNCWNCLMTNPKPDPHNINAHIIFGENPLRLTEVIVLKLKCGHVLGRQLCQKLTIFAHTQSQTGSPKYQYTKFGEKPLRFILYHPEINIPMCCRQITDKNWQNLPIRNPTPDLHKINAHTKFGENLVIVNFHEVMWARWDLALDLQTH